MTKPQSQLQPAPFRVPLVDAQGQLVEVWRRFFLSTQAIINTILAGQNLGTPHPALLSEDPIADEGLMIPGPPGPIGPIGAQGIPGLDGQDPEETWPIPGVTGSTGPAGVLGPPGMDGDAATDELWMLGGGLTNLLTLFTQGSVVFVGPSGQLAQNNANFFWDNTNLRIGVGTATPQEPVDASGAVIVRGQAVNTIASTALFDFATPAGRIIARGPDTLTDGNIQFITTRSDGTFSTIALRIGSAGQVGIGIVPTSLLHVNGTAHLVGAVTNDSTLQQTGKATFSVAPMVPASLGTAVWGVDCTDSGTLTIANAAVAQPFSNVNNFAGIFIVTDTSVTGQTGVFVEGGGVMGLLGQSGTLYTVTSGTAAKVNVYMNPSTIVEIQNNQGNSINFRILALRTRISA